jgi:putative FmdB family regulatory protein
MPLYAFECQECLVRFERTLKMGDHTTHPCPSCKDDAPRILDQQGFGFGFAASASAAPANTGVHADDYPTADRAVGKSAESRWEVISDREKVKGEARKQGETHALIRHTGPGFIDYEPMSDVGRNARRKLAKAAVDAAKVARQGEVKPPR